MPVEAVIQMSGKIRTDLSRGREERSATSAISTGSDRPPDVQKYGGFTTGRQQIFARSIPPALKCIHTPNLHGCYGFSACAVAIAARCCPCSASHGCEIVRCKRSAAGCLNQKSTCRPSGSCRETRDFGRCPMPGFRKMFQLWPMFQPAGTSAKMVSALGLEPRTY